MNHVWGEAFGSEMEAEGSWWESWVGLEMQARERGVQPCFQISKQHSVSPTRMHAYNKDL